MLSPLQQLLHSCTRIIFIAGSLAVVAKLCISILWRSMWSAYTHKSMHMPTQGISKDHGEIYNKAYCVLRYQASSWDESSSPSSPARSLRKKVGDDKGKPAVGVVPLNKQSVEEGDASREGSQKSHRTNNASSQSLSKPAQKMAHDADGGLHVKQGPSDSPKKVLSENNLSLPSPAHSGVLVCVRVSPCK
jgi:hypothetical protein